MSSLLKSITESTTCMKSANAMQVDATSGKENMCKNFIHNKWRLKNMHLDVCQKWKVWEKLTVKIYICWVICNTYRFWSIQNHCKESHKCWNWNNRNGEEASTYHWATKGFYPRKKLIDLKLDEAVAKHCYLEKTKYPLLPQVVIPTIASHVKLTITDKTPNTTLHTTPITSPNTPSKPIMCNILTKRPVNDTEKGNVKRILKDIVAFNLHDEIDDSQCLTAELYSPWKLLWTNSMLHDICYVYSCNHIWQLCSVVLFWEWKY